MLNEKYKKPNFFTITSVFCINTINSSLFEIISTIIQNIFCIVFVKSLISMATQYCNIIVSENFEQKNQFQSFLNLKTHSTSTFIKKIYCKLKLLKLLIPSISIFNFTWFLTVQFYASNLQGITSLPYSVGLLIRTVSYVSNMTLRCTKR